MTNTTLKPTAWAIKGPGGEIDNEHIAPSEGLLKLDFTGGVPDRWSELEAKGYRAVRVAIVEVE